MKRAWALGVLIACGHGGAPAVGPGSAPLPVPVADAAIPNDAGAAVAVDPPEAIDAGATVVTAPPDARVAVKTPPPPKGPPKVVQINQPGELIDIDKSLVADHVTIVDFWATWCGGCKVMEEKFMAAIGDDPRVVVRKVDVGDGDTPVAKHYGVRGLPQVWIYDAKKRLRYVLVANDALQAGPHALELAREKSGN